MAYGATALSMAPRRRSASHAADHDILLLELYQRILRHKPSPTWLCVAWMDSSWSRKRTIDMIIWRQSNSLKRETDNEPAKCCDS